MTVFLSETPRRNLDTLSDVKGFTQADAGVAYSFQRDTIGGVYRPIPTIEAGSCVDPAGGLEKDLDGCLRIKPDATSGDSGLALSTNGVSVVGRVKTTGDNMTGILTMNQNRIADLLGPLTEFDAANKEYVDLRLLKTGDTMSGPINMGSQLITFLDTPVDPTDAANKAYVDAAIVELDEPRAILNPPPPWDNAEVGVSGLYQSSGKLGLAPPTFTGHHVFETQLTQMLTTGIAIQPGTRIINSGYGLNAFGVGFDLFHHLLYRFTAILARGSGTATFRWNNSDTGVTGTTGEISTDGNMPAVCYATGSLFTVNMTLVTQSDSGGASASGLQIFIDVMGSSKPGYFQDLG